MKFSDFAELASILEQDVVGLVEIMLIEDVGKAEALIDSGNGAHNVLHGVNVNIEGNNVTFDTINGKTVTKEIVEEIQINVGSGHKEMRPVVEFTIEMNETVYHDIKFSIADRSDNDYPVLVGADFIGFIDALIDVNKGNGLMS